MACIVHRRHTRIKKIDFFIDISKYVIHVFCFVSIMYLYFCNIKCG